MPVILAETIIRLDNFKEHNRLSGSLILLQVCNQNLFYFYFKPWLFPKLPSQVFNLAGLL